VAVCYKYILKSENIQNTHPELNSLARCVVLSGGWRLPTGA